jgi:hypothetical protein
LPSASASAMALDEVGFSVTIRVYIFLIYNIGKDLYSLLLFLDLLKATIFMQCFWHFNAAI